jgi:Highly conserved protein containing a thioredoxin domain
LARSNRFPKPCRPARIRSLMFVPAPLVCRPPAIRRSWRNFWN